MSDTATPDRIFKDAASWWLEGNYKPREGATGLDKVKDMLGGLSPVTQGEAITAGRGSDFTTKNEVPRDAMTEAGFIADERAQKQERTIVRYGTVNGRRVALYSDGSKEYVK